MTQPTIEQVHTGGAHGSETSGLDDEVHALAAELSRLKRDYQDLAASLNPLLSRKTIPYLRVHGLEIGKDFFRGEQGFLQFVMAASGKRAPLYFVTALDPDPLNNSNPLGILEAFTAGGDSVQFNFASRSDSNNFSEFQMFNSTSVGGIIVGRVTQGGQQVAEFRLNDDAFQIDDVPLEVAQLTSDPSTLRDGMGWYRSDTDVFHGRANGVTETFAFLSDLTGLSLGGDIAFTMQTKSTAYEASPGDFVLVSGTTTITLPENAAAGSVIVVKKTDSGTTSTVSRKTADTIDGGTTYAMTTQYEAASFLSDGSDWWVW